MSRELPERPNLEYLKKQAKELLRSLEHGDPAASQRFQTQDLSSEHEAPKLADALHVIAREYGFRSWPKLKEHVESVLREREPHEMLSAAVFTVVRPRVSAVRCR